MKKIDEILKMIQSESFDERTKAVVISGNVRCLTAFFRPFMILKSSFDKHEYAVIVARRSDSELLPYLDYLVSWSCLAECYDYNGTIIYERLCRMARTDEFMEALANEKQICALRDDEEAARGTDRLINEEYLPFVDFSLKPAETRPDFEQYVEGMDEPCDIDVAVEMMKSTNPEEIQEQGRAIARSIESIYCFSDVLVHPEQEASRLNLARILCEHTDRELNYGKLLFIWIEDLEKDYAKVCFDRLLEIKPNDNLDRCILNILEPLPYCDPKSPALKKLQTDRKEKYYSR